VKGAKMSFLLTRGSRGRARSEERHRRRSVAVVLSVVTGLLVAANRVNTRQREKKKITNRLTHGCLQIGRRWEEAEKSLIELNFIHC
jgi:hypothetical protein